MRVTATATARTFGTVLEGHLPAVSADRHLSIVAVENVAVVVAFELVGSPQTHFVHQVHIVVFKRGYLRIRCLMVIVIEQLPAAAGDGLRQFDPEAPPGDVDLVYAVVARVACSVVPEPVPVIVEPVAIERPLRCRPEPEVIVDVRGCFTVGHTADGAPPLAVNRLGHSYFAKLARLQVLDCIIKSFCAAGLCAVLNNPAVLAGQIHQQTSLGYRVAQRLLDIYIFACYNRERSQRHVPMVRRRNGNHIDRFVFEHPAIVGVGIDLLIAVFELLDFAVQDIAVHIAQRNYAHSRNIVETARKSTAPPIDTCDRHGDTVICTSRTGKRQCQCDTCGHRSFHKIPACNTFHNQYPFIDPKSNRAALPFQGLIAVSSSDYGGSFYKLPKPFFNLLLRSYPFINNHEEPEMRPFALLKAKPKRQHGILLIFALPLKIPLS